MENSALSIPDDTYVDKTGRPAYQLACEKLATVDLEQQCRNSGATCETINSKKVATLDFLNRSYQIIPPDQIILKGSTEEVLLSVASDGCVEQL